ncbi:hypothetical protein [Roseateles sp. BYS87W]|uniref:Uncharacterized protein n=1 Tax=Pelomonas baiyunensis TaxID=3299026 RepID=A0ABW7GX60_9BURK
MLIKRLAIIAFLAAPSIGSAKTWAVPSKEVWTFLNTVATSKIGKSIECSGKWNMKADDPNEINIRCLSLGVPAEHPVNYLTITEYIFNGWEVTDRQVFPMLNEMNGDPLPSWKRVIVRLKKVEIRKQFEDRFRGTLDPEINPNLGK